MCFYPIDTVFFLSMMVYPQEMLFFTWRVVSSIKVFAYIKFIYIFKFFQLNYSKKYKHLQLEPLLHLLPLLSSLGQRVLVEDWPGYLGGGVALLGVLPGPGLARRRRGSLT